MKTQPRKRFLVSALAAGFALLALPGNASATTPSDVEPAACSWGPGTPYTWSSAHTGYLRAKLTVSSGCSANDDWEGELQTKALIGWTGRDSLAWRGTADQMLQWDCKDGDSYTVRALMVDIEANVTRISPEIKLTCP